jgi:hypothetical protein
MKRLLLAGLATAALAVPVAASGSPSGCWATVKLSSLPSTLVWNVNVTPLQHGRTMLPNAKPRVEIRPAAGGTWKVFKARPTLKRGVYRAAVVFASEGTWRFRVWDGFEPHCARYHSYAPVTIKEV